MEFVEFGAIVRLSVVFGVVSIACSSDADTPSRTGSGGASANGGARAIGGAASSGGANMTGGSGGAGGRSNGGSTAGGAPGTGGAVGTGGAPIPPSGPVVTTSAGKVQGFVEGATNKFLGVPYGASPTGDLRFAPPKPAPAWPDVRAATAPGDFCPRATNPTTDFGGAQPPQSEDCLNLNVYTPSATPTKAPVIVFIPSNPNGNYDAGSLSAAGGAVVVSINYRVGALGYLVNAALDTVLGVPSGNMGLRDQQLALTWVKENIAAFGGDPGNVTILGQSCLHLFAPDSRLLARRFVMNSSSCVSNPTMPLKRSSVQWLSDKLMTKLCPSAADPVACLRGLAPEAFTSFKNVDTTDPGPDPFGQGFYPQMDGVVLEDYPKRLLQSDDFNHGEVLAGANLHEAQITRLDPEQTKQLKNSKLAFGFYGIFTYITQWPAIQSLYTPATDADAIDSFERVSTDTWFRCPIRAIARAAAEKGSRVYLYSFDLTPAVAAQELDYVFGRPVQSPVLEAPPFDTAAPVPLAGGVVTAMQTYLVNFAKSGDPNGEGGGAAAWPAYTGTATADQHLVLDATVKLGTAFSKKECDTWDSANAGSEY